MHPHRATVEERAHAALEVFAFGLEEAGILQTIQDAYVAGLERLPGPAIIPNIADWRPVLFELVCFGAHLILGMAKVELAPKRKWFGLARGDGKAEAFEYALLEPLQQFVASHGLHVREPLLVKVGPPAKYGWSEPVSPMRRLQQYAAGSSRAHAFDLFSRVLANAIDQERYPVTMIIAGHVAPIVARVAQMALSFVFTAAEDEIDKALAHVRHKVILDGERVEGRCLLFDAALLDLRSWDDLPLERLETLVADDDHFSLSVERCLECGQLFLRCFAEIVLYQVGRDDECWVYFLPVTAAEVKRIKLQPEIIRELFNTRRSLTWPPDGQVYWSRGLPVTLTWSDSPAPLWFREAQ